MPSNSVRTQVYLDPRDHRQLKELAVRRGVSMTNLVRAAVAHYVTEELDDARPSVQEMAGELYADPLYAGVSHRPEGLVARQELRRLAPDQDTRDPGAMHELDLEVGAALAAEHAEQVEAFAARPANGGT